jgi:hypothetical protein
MLNKSSCLVLAVGMTNLCSALFWHINEVRLSLPDGKKLVDFALVGCSKLN